MSEDQKNGQVLQLKSETERSHDPDASFLFMQTHIVFWKADKIRPYSFIRSDIC